MTRFSSIATRTAGPLCLLLVSACATVPNLGPAPKVAPAAAYESDRSFAVAAGDAAAGWPDQAWWHEYGDPQLDALIAEALAGSPDVAAAAARVRQADAYAQQAGAARLPTLDGSASAGGTKQSYNNGIPAAFVPKGWNDTGRIQADLGFDLDLWGRNKASYAAARSDADAARLDFAQSALTLSTSVADAYADLAKLFAERAVQARALDIRTQTAKLTSDRVASGLDTQAELKQAQSAVPAARADLAATDEQIALTRNRLAALLGKGPDRGLSITAPVVTLASRSLPADATTNLIGRRPDIVAARTRVEAEASRIKVARADFYPSINLSATIGFQALGLGNVFKSGSSFGSAAPAISLPIFRGGELQGKYRNARATYDEAVANYDRTVTDAYRAVADAVASQRSVGVQLADQRQSLLDAQAAYGVARQRYEGGLSRFVDVLTAQDRALQSQRYVTDLQARAFTLDIALVRALGGGFAAPAAPVNAAQINKDKTNG
ncbi:efflux transporter outer membrane subunit [Sphingomonas sp. M1A8_2b]